MKLIDLDAFYKFCAESLKIGHEVYPEYYDDYLESDMFTVKAIPIEWIKKWCNEEHNRKSLEERLLKRYGVITMLDDWEKENEESI